MTATNGEVVKHYYRKLRELDIGTVARELLGSRIKSESEHLLQCDCTRHESQSHLTLHIMLDKQGWYCHGCGIGGDVLQLVEFVQSGDVTRGKNGRMPQSHRDARDFLGKKAGLPPLSTLLLSEEEREKAEKNYQLELRVTAALSALARYYHQRLLATPDAMHWLKDHYAISDATIAQLQIGYAANSSYADAEGNMQLDVTSELIRGKERFTPKELVATGAFRKARDSKLQPFFERRIVFPYWSRGRVVFLIGRRTPWTPDEAWEQGKYKKLPVYNAKKHPHVAPCIDNSHLFNEDCLLGRPSRAVVTEGVVDCIALMERGFPTVSPVTVQIRSADWDRLLPRLKQVKTVYICQDNEVSEAGLAGALRTARILGEHEVDTRLVILPLEPSQVEARAALHERFRITPGMDPRKRKDKLAHLTEDERREAEALLAAAKLDVNDYFRLGHTAAEFESLLASAQTPLELSISSLPVEDPEAERNRKLEPILDEIASMEPLELDRHLKLIRFRLGKEAPAMATLQKQVRAIQKARRVHERQEARKARRHTGAEAGSCRARIEQVVLETEAKSGMPDYARVAEAAFNWLGDHGAQFFRTMSGEPFMFFEDAILWLDSPDRGRRRLYQSAMFSHAGIVPTTAGGRTFYEVLANLAVEHGQVREHFCWLHSDVSHYTVFFNLNNPEHEIAKITPDGVEVLKNGGNADGVILDGSRKMSPIKYLPGSVPEDADRLLRELIFDNLTCLPGDRLLILSWLSCFLLIDFTGTRPMARFEGQSGSGKTTASKLTSALVFGEPQQKKSTDAANYTDGSQNPLIVLDNIEVKQMTEDLVTFMLTSITGIAKEKRKGGTDTETIIERTKCLLNTTGIEPLGGELSEILSRSFTICFDMDDQASDCFLEAKVLANIREHRNLLLSALMKRTSQVLALLQDGAQEKVMRLLHQALGNHGKRRCNDYLSLMYLMMLAGEPAEAVQHALDVLDPRFIDQLASLNQTSEETGRASNSIATCLATLFNAYRHALEADAESTADKVTKSNKAAFLERFQLEFADENTIQGALARDLFVALRRVAKEFSLTFHMTSVQQFVQRFSNDLNTIQKAGFEVVVHRPTKVRGTATYDIACHS